MSRDERMHLAADAGDIDEVRRLLELGVPVDFINISYGTALHSISHCSMDHSRALAIMRLLIQNGSDAATGCRTRTPLHKACTYLFAA